MFGDAFDNIVDSLFTHLTTSLTVLLMHIVSSLSIVTALSVRWRILWSTWWQLLQFVDAFDDVTDRLRTQSMTSQIDRCRCCWRIRWRNRQFDDSSLVDLVLAGKCIRWRPDGQLLSIFELFIWQCSVEVTYVAMKLNYVVTAELEVTIQCSYTVKRRSRKVFTHSSGRFLFKQPKELKTA